MADEPEYTVQVQSQGDKYRRIMCIRDASGNIPDASPRVNECLGDLNDAPSHGTNIDGANVRANEVKFRKLLITMRDSDGVCRDMQFWVDCTEPVRV